MTTVTLLIFSGRPDPKWELPEEDGKVLAELLGSTRSAPEISTLGYRGFLVESNGAGLPSRIVVRGLPRVERFLLQTGQRLLPPEVARIVTDAIK